LVDTPFFRADNKVIMQLSFKSRRNRRVNRPLEAPAKLTELREGQEAVIDRLDLPDDVARRLMEMGFLPGTTITAGRSAPGGDPKVFRVDGCEIALRQETAAQLYLKT
jgi:ferrous iron transport protein A